MTVWGVVARKQGSTQRSVLQHLGSPMLTQGPPVDGDQYIHGSHITPMLQPLSFAASILVTCHSRSDTEAIHSDIP